MESGRGRRRGVLESEDLQPHRPPQMTGQARDEEEDEERGGGEEEMYADCGTESGRGRRPGGLEGGGGKTRCMQTVGWRAGEEGDGAYWRARIYNDTGDPR